MIRSLIATLLFLLSFLAPPPAAAVDHVALLDMELTILPGTEEYLERSIERATNEGAKLIVVKLNTPGGILHTTQNMIQDIFESPIPVAIYVTPAGGSATSAGVFITMAAHVAAMAPGTSIGAAHPVMGNGDSLKGDMRDKAENMAIAMVKSISEQRGRNVSWAEKAVKESASVTETEALNLRVVDFIAKDIDHLLQQTQGKEVLLKGEKYVIPNLSSLPRINYDISFRQKVINVFADPNVAALLWLGASTGLAIELYNPGLVLPGIVGILCLIMALTVSQVIPINTGGILLLVAGGFMIGAEAYVTSGVLGLGGIVAIVLGAMYLIDVSQAPDLTVALDMFVPFAVVLGTFSLLVAFKIKSSRAQPLMTGYASLIGGRGQVMVAIEEQGKVFVNGEIWKAKGVSGAIPEGKTVEVVGEEGGVLRVKEV